MKKSELVDKVEQLSKCLKDKDSRLTRIEERWSTFIGCLIISLSVGSVVGYVTGCIFMNIYLLDIGMDRATSIAIAVIEIAFPIALFFSFFFFWILMVED